MWSGVGVRGDQQVDVSYPLALQVGQHVRRCGAAVHQDVRVALVDQYGVSLTHVDEVHGQDLRRQGR
jgi:hypothetical protein